MENWLADELVGTERLTCSPTGYTNNQIAMDYLDHLIEHSRAGPNKPWKMLLLDGHESHRTDTFQLKAAENHIKLFFFPSHLTHVLQPLDVGIFQPWKHYHDLAVQRALHSLDFEYSITSFFRDLTSIRQQTMQKHTIMNAFKNSGMWPVSSKAGLKKMRAYKKKKKRTIDDVEEDGDLDLPPLPPSRPEDLWNTSAKVRVLADRDPTLFSDPSVQLFRSTMKAVDIELQKAHLKTIEHTALQEKIRNENKRKRTSRRSIHKRGPSARVKDLREKKAIRDQEESVAALRKAERRLSLAINKAKKDLKERGIQARKDEKARLRRVKECTQKNELPCPEDLFPVREPDKQPTQIEALMCTAEYYPELVQAIKEAKVQDTLVMGDGDDVVFRLGDSQDKENVPDYMDSSPPPRDLADSSDVESHAGSIDSILRNADFIAF